MGGHSLPASIGHNNQGDPWVTGKKGTHQPIVRSKKKKQKQKSEGESRELETSQVFLGAFEHYGKPFTST